MLLHIPQAWKPEHSLLIVRLMSYVGLAQTQEDVERLILQSLNQAIDNTKLKSLFGDHLDGLNPERIERLRQLKYIRKGIPFEIKALNSLPKLLASNNWVLSPAKTKGRKALLCCDPHLEVNRLPGVWFEFRANTNKNEFAGISMPGVPGLIMGRTRHLAYSFTYGFYGYDRFFSSKKFAMARPSPTMVYASLIGATKRLSARAKNRSNSQSEKPKAVL